MTTSSPDNWLNAISKPTRIGVEDGFVSWKVSKICPEKLDQAIKQYGVNTKINGTRLLDLINFMECDVVDVFMKYKPNMIFKGYVYMPNQFLKNRYYILQKIIENDVDYKYNRYPFRLDGYILYDNLLEFAEEEEHRKGLSCAWGCCDKEEGGCEQHPERKIVTLLHNHMKRGTTLFELMTPCLEESDKKRRFQ